MASALERIISIIFEGEDRASPEIRAVSESLRDLGGVASSTLDAVADITQKILLMEVAATALGAALAYKAVGAATEFESALAGLTKSMDGNKDASLALVADIDALALKYGESSNVLIKSTEDFVLAGYQEKTALDLVKQSMDLAIAGGIDTATATEKLKASLAGFEIPADSAAGAAKRMADVLNHVADVTKSGFPELMDAFARVSPLAHLAGLSFEETASYLSKMVDVFQDGEKAGQALGSGLQSLSDPSKEAQKALAGAGVSTVDLTGKLRPVKDILADLGTNFYKLDEATKFFTVSVIFGKEQAAKMVTVMNGWEDAQNRVTDAVANSGGTVDREVVVRLATAAQVIKSTNEAWSQFLRDLGRTSQVETTDLVKSIGNIGLALKEVVNGPALDPLLNLIRPQLERLSEMINTVAKNLPEAFKGVDFSGLAKAFEDLGTTFGEAFEKLFGKMDLSTVEGLKDALQKVVDTGTGLVRWTDAVVQAYGPMLSIIGRLADEFRTLDPETQKMAGSLMGLATVANQVTPAIDTMILAFIALRGTGIAATLTGLIPLLGQAGLAGAAGVAGYGLGTVLYDGVTRVTQAMTNSQNTLGTWLYEITHGDEKITETTKKIEGVGGAIKGLGEITDDSVTKTKDFDGSMDMLGKSTEGFGANLQTLRDTWYNLGFQLDTSTGQVSMISNKFTEAKEAAQGFTTTYENGVPVYTQVGNIWKSNTDKLADQKKKLDEAKAASLDWALEMEKIASNERIKKIEAVVSLNVAQMQADTEKVKAAFGSIDNSISSSGDLLKSLFGDFNAAKSDWDKSFIQTAIEKEMARRTQLFEDQHALIQEQINLMRARADRLAAGDPMITVDGTGLKPHLEAFMWEILKTIQIRANAEMQEFLLGAA